MHAVSWALAGLLVAMTGNVVHADEPAAAAPSAPVATDGADADASEEPAAAAPAQKAAGIERSAGDYFKYGMLGLPFIALFVEDEPYHPKVAEGGWLASFVGSLFSPFGGHLWAPALFYGTPPEGPAASRARMFGYVSVALAWTAILCWPLLFIPVKGWALFIGIVFIESVYQYDVAPRMIALAYSDAYGGPARKQEDDDQDEGR